MSPRPHLPRSPISLYVVLCRAWSCAFRCRGDRLLFGQVLEDHGDGLALYGDVRSAFAAPNHRVFVEGRGCGGIQILLGRADERRVDDVRLAIDAYVCHIQKAHRHGQGLAKIAARPSKDTLMLLHVCCAELLLQCGSGNHRLQATVLARKGTAAVKIDGNMAELASRVQFADYRRVREQNRRTDASFDAHEKHIRARLGQRNVR